MKEIGKKYILWMVDVFSRMLAGVVLKDKKAETILEKLEMEWCLMVRIIYIDQTHRHILYNYYNYIQVLIISHMTTISYFLGLERSCPF